MAQALVGKTGRGICVSRGSRVGRNATNKPFVPFAEKDRRRKLKPCKTLWPWQYNTTMYGGNPYRVAAILVKTLAFYKLGAQSEDYRQLPFPQSSFLCECSERHQMLF